MSNLIWGLGNTEHWIDLLTIQGFFVIETQNEHLEVWPYWVIHPNNENSLNDDSRNLLALPSALLSH